MRTRRVDEYLEKFGKVLAFGWGDDVAFGAAIELLERVSPDKLYQYISEGGSLINGISDEDWAKLRPIATKIKLDLTTERIVEELRESRTDLLGVIINDPGGMNWLNKQVSEIRAKLGIDS